jgi:hypothetical protein
VRHEVFFRSTSHNKERTFPRFQAERKLSVAESTARSEEDARIRAVESATSEAALRAAAEARERESATARERAEAAAATAETKRLKVG